MEHIEQHVIIRFNKSFNKVGDCFLWNKYLDRDGYGTFYFMKKGRRAHRVSYFMKYGDIPKEMVIDHTCKNRSCVNPDHLRCVTKLQNTMENSNSVGAINKAKTHCKNGHLFDKFYGQRYCSICQAEKTRRLRKKWLTEANKIMC